MTLEIQMAGVTAQSREIDSKLQGLVVRLANERIEHLQAGGRVSDEQEEEDVLYALVMTTVRQLLDENRLIIKMLEQLLRELAPDRLAS